MEFFAKGSLLFSIIKGCIIAFVFTIMSLVVLSALLVYTELSEDVIKPAIITITGVSILLGSSVGTRYLKKNGLINGACVGGIYILILYLISSLLNSYFLLNLTSVIMIFVGVICGIIGGVIGVNTKKS